MQFIKEKPANLLTSICILRCILNLDSKATKIASDSSNTSGTEETPFFERATHRYCLIAVTNIAFDLNTGPADCNIDNSRCKDKIFERNS